MAPITNIPPELKKITVFLRRAEELDRDKSSPESRVVAYNCRQYAVLTGIPLSSNSIAAKKCLGEILDQLENEKAAMSVFSKKEHWTICRKVADKVFDKADNEDRLGVADKGTAKTFYAAGTFYEILQQFYEKDAELSTEEDKEKMAEEEQRRLYCKWKATDILNAIKEGRVPTPGGYQQEGLEGGDVMEGMEGAVVPMGNGESGEAGRGGGGRSSEGEGSASSTEKTSWTTAAAEYELPPPPSMPSGNLFIPATTSAPTSAPSNGPSSSIPLDHDTFENGMSNSYIKDDAHNADRAFGAHDTHDAPPPPYDGIELNLDGNPQVTLNHNPLIVEDVNEDSDDGDGGNDDIFIPGHSKKTNTSSKRGSTSSLDVDESLQPHQTNQPNQQQSRSIPTAAPPPSHTSQSNVANAASEMFHSLFHKSSSNPKLSKEQMKDAIELTKFALAALQKGDGELGRARLEQALGIWKR